MSARGGSRYSVEFLLTMAGDREIISRFNQVGNAAQRMQGQVQNIGTGTRAAAGAMSTLSNAMQQTSAATNQNIQAASRLGGVYNAQGQMVRGTASTFSQYNSALSSNTQAQSQNYNSMKLSTLVMDEMRPRMTGLAISAVMLTNSVSEAAFMQDVLSDAQARTAEAQAKLTELEARGAQGTVEYTRAKADLARAERAEAIFRRNAMQASMDQLNFIVLLGASMGPLIVKVAEWARAQVNAANSTNLLTKAVSALSLTNLRASFTQWTNGLAGVVTAQTTGVKSTIALADGTTKLATVQRLAATSATPLNVAIKGTTASSFAATGAMTGLSAAFGVNAAAATGATGAITRLGLAARALMLHPVFLILTGIAVVLTAVATNAWGFRDAIDGAGKAIGDAIPGLRGFLDGLRDVGEMIGIVPEEVNEIGISVKEADERFTEMQGTLNGTMDSFDEFKSVVLESVQALTSVTNMMEGTLMQAHDNLAAAFEAGIITIEEFNYVMGKIVDVERAAGAGLEEMSDIVVDFSDNAEVGLTKLRETAHSIPGAFSGIPREIEPHVQKFIEAVDKMALSPAEKLELLTDLINGRVSPAFMKLGADGVTAAGLIANFMNDLGGTNADKIKALAPLIEELGADFMYVGEAAEASSTMLDEASASFEEMVQSGIDLAAQLGHTDQMVGMSREGWAAYAVAMDIVNKETGPVAMANLRGQAIAMQQLNPQLETNVNLLKATKPELEAVIAGWEEQLKGTEAVATAIDELNASYAESAAQLPALSAQMLDLNVAIDEQTRFEANLTASKEEFIDMTYAEEDAIRVEAMAIARVNGETEAYIETLGRSTEASQEYLDKIEAKAQADEDAAKASEEAAKAQDQHNQAIAAMLPTLQALAEEYGLVNRAMLDSDPLLQRQFDHLERLDGQYDSAREAAEAFAISHGESIVNAVNMTDAELLESVEAFAEVERAEKQTAEEAKRSAQDFADAWTDGLDKAVEALEHTTQVLGGAMDNLFERMNAKLDDNEFMDLSFMEDFWDRWFPAEIVEAKFEEGFDIDRMVDKVRNRIDNAVDKGLITKEQAERWFQPLQDYLQDDLPSDSEEAFGAVVAKFAIFEDMLRPVMLGGVIEVGHELKQEIDDSMMQPMISAVVNGTEGMLGPNFLDAMRNAMGSIRELSPEVAGYMEAILNDADLTTQEKVQMLIATFDQLSPGFRDTIMKIDRDMDGLPDILDEDIGEPFEDLKNAIVEAFREILDQLGLLPEQARAVGGELENAIRPIESIATNARDVWSGLGADLETNVSEPMRQLGRTFADEGETVRMSLFAIRKASETDIADSVSHWYGLRDGVRDSVTVINRDVNGLTKTVYDFSDGTVTTFGQIGSALETNEEKLSNWTSMWRTDIPEAGRVMKETESGVISGTGGIGLALDSNKTGWQTWRSNIVTDTDRAKGSTKDASDAITGDVERMQSSITASTASSMGWAQHAQAVSGFVTMIGESIKRYIGLYDAMGAQVTAKMTAAAAGWTTHAALVNQTVDGIAITTGRYMQALSAMNPAVNGILTGLTTLWLLHQQAVGIQVGIIFGTHMAGYVAHLAVMNIGLASQLTTATTHWLQHQLAVGIQAGVIFGTHMTGYVSNLAVMNIGLSQQLTTATTHWLQHQLAVGIQLGVIFGTHMAGYVSNLAVMNIGLSTQLTTATTHWLNHQLAVGIQVGTIFGTHMAAYISNLAVMNIGLANQLTTATTHWLQHQQAVGIQVNEIGSTHMIKYVTGVGLMAQGIFNALALANNHWDAHQRTVGAQVGIIHGTHMTRYVAQAAVMVSGINRQLTNSSENWVQHQQVVDTQTGIINNWMIAMQRVMEAVSSAGIRALDRLGAGMSRVADGIVSDANRAINALEDLQDQIDSMRSKTITVTTRRVTTSSGGGGGGSSSGGGGRASGSGRMSSQHGHFGVVDSPTRVMVGEGGGKEFFAALPVGRGANADESVLRSLIGTARGAAGGGKREIVIISPIILDRREIGKVIRRTELEGIGGFT